MKTMQEVIKALEICNSTDVNIGCEQCPYQGCHNCGIDKFDDALKNLKNAATMKDTYEALCKEMYEEGMRKAWDVATKIAFVDKDGAFTCKEFNEIFGNKSKGEVFTMSPQEVLKKIEEWEEKKEEEEFKVGDVVRYVGPEDIDGLKGVVSSIKGYNIYVIWQPGFSTTCKSYDLEKSGKTINVEAFLKLLN